MKSKLIKIILLFGFIKIINCLKVEISTDGPGVLDLPITFTAKLSGDSLDDQYWYEFSDRGIFPPHRGQTVAGPEVNYTTTYSNVSIGIFVMKVQVFVYIWGLKGWLIADNEIHFKLQNSLVVDINIRQSGILEEAIARSLVAANRTVQLSAHINGSHVMKNASTNYTWHLEGHTIGPNSWPDLNYTFTANKTYNLEVVVVSNIHLLHSNITKLGNKRLTLSAKNEIKDMNITGNTYILDGDLLHLKVNCSGGDPPFRYCYDFFNKKPDNYTCHPLRLFGNDCYFPITRYFRKNDTYFIQISVFNELNFRNKTITVKVYDIVRKTQLIFVIIPIMSSILAIIIIVVGIAYHLQQRQRLNLTLEVADFDFQNNDNLEVKTFFERLRESLGSALRETFTYPCNPCTQPTSYEDIIDDTLPDQNNINTDINTNNVSYGILK